MPPNDDFMKELLAVFAGEARERLSLIDEHLVALEQTDSGDERRALLADVQRELHTLKGSSAAVELSEASRMAHGLENLIDRIDPARAIRPDTIDVIYRALDAFRLMVSDFGGGAAGIDVDALLASLNEPLDGTEDPTAHRTPTPVSRVSTDAAESPWLTGGTGPIVDPVDLVSVAIPVMEPPRTGAWDQADADVAPPAPPPVAMVAEVPVRDPASPRNTGPGSDDTVRLSTRKLDSLMTRVSELVTVRIESERRVEEVSALVGLVGEYRQMWRQMRPQLTGVATADAAREVEPFMARGDELLTALTDRTRALREGLQSDERRFGTVTADLETEVRQTRMLTVATVLDPFRRIVRDLARELGKDCTLVIDGGDTDVDRSVLDEIRAPLTHLIRNCVDHGIESPTVRELSGKPRQGTIRVAASERGGSLHLRVSDDGGGIDAGAVRTEAIASGLVGADQMRSLTERDVLRLIFRSGFTTNSRVTDISGRGIGLDAVRETVERLQGVIDVSTDIGVGTSFTMSLPLSVATAQSLLMRVAGHTFAFPIGQVDQIIRVGAPDIRRAQGREMVVTADGPVVLARLEDVLQLTTVTTDASDDRKPAVIVGQGDRRFALLVDDILGTQEVVVKPLPRPFIRVRHTAGAATLSSGDLVLVLNASDLIRTAVRTVARTDRPADSGAPVPVRTGRGTILVVDDSIVTRTLERSILEAAGYTVNVAVDGVDAWTSLATQPVDLIVSDVNMPNMDGLALTAQVRSDPRMKDTPVVIVTSLDSRDDHIRALDSGADAYIVKSSLNQETLLDAVSRLI
jgi:two-component system chemotaxis sensor kinase CheA